MAIRPVFVAGLDGSLCGTTMTEFQYFNGFSAAQRKRSSHSLHESFLQEFPGRKVLEISSFSEEELGVQLSAFNLMLKLQDGREVSVECAFQAGKIFAEGGPYLDLLNGTSKEAKKDPRLKNSGALKGFYFEGETFELVPRTHFYNWLYIHGLNAHPELADALMAYDAFTDIVFNPEKASNCQAEAAACYVALRKLGLLEEALKSKEDFIRVLYREGQSGKMNTRVFDAAKGTAKPSAKADQSIWRPEPKTVVEDYVSVFKPGDRILHPKFGEGEVLRITQRKGSAMLQVQFPVGLKDMNETWIVKNCRRI